MPSLNTGGDSMRGSQADAVDVSMESASQEDPWVVSDHLALTPTQVHPACRLVRKPRGPLLADCFQVCVHEDWWLERLGCDACGVLQPIDAFPRACRSQALRRIRRALAQANPRPRGRGGIRCRQCVLSVKAPKSLVLEAIQKGQLRGTLTMKLDLDVPGRDEAVVSFVSSLDLAPGHSLKTMEAELWGEAAPWVADSVGVCSTSSEETDDDEHM